MRPLLLVLTLAVAVLASPALASTVIAESIEEMAVAAPLVVHARVVAAQSGWDAAHRRLWTWTELQVSEPLKGLATTNTATVLVKQPGGEADGIGQAVAGAARFAIGEEVVAFLEPSDEPNVFLVRGLSAGKVRLEQRGARQVALRALDGLAFARVGAVAKEAPARDELGSAEAFLARVRRAVQAGAR